MLAGSGEKVMPSESQMAGKNNCPIWTNKRATRVNLALTKRMVAMGQLQRGFSGCYDKKSVFGGLEERLLACGVGVNRPAVYSLLPKVLSSRPETAALLVFFFINASGRHRPMRG